MTDSPLTREDLRTMKPEEVLKAHDEGRLNHLMREGHYVQASAERKEPSR